MVDANNTIALVSSTHFKWTAQVQYMETLPTRIEAIRYANQRGANLIVMYEKRTGPKFDVLQDPNLPHASEAEMEKMHFVRVVYEPESVGWTKLMFRGMFRLAKRVGTAATASRRESAVNPVQG